METILALNEISKAKSETNEYIRTMENLTIPPVALTVTTSSTAPTTEEAELGHQLKNELTSDATRSEQGGDSQEFPKENAEHLELLDEEVKEVKKDLRGKCKIQILRRRELEMQERERQEREMQELIKQVCETQEHKMQVLREEVAKLEVPLRTFKIVIITPRSPKPVFKDNLRDLCFNLFAQDNIYESDSKIQQVTFTLPPNPPSRIKISVLVKALHGKDVVETLQESVDVAAVLILYPWNKVSKLLKIMKSARGSLPDIQKTAILPVIFADDSQIETLIQKRGNPLKSLSELCPGTITFDSIEQDFLFAGDLEYSVYPTMLLGCLLSRKPVTNFSTATSLPPNTPPPKKPSSKGPKEEETKSDSRKPKRHDGATTVTGPKGPVSPAPVMPWEGKGKEIFTLTNANRK